MSTLFLSRVRNFKVSLQFCYVSLSVTEAVKFSEGLCKVCSWGLSSFEKSEISKFHYNFVKCLQVLQRQ